MIFAKDPLQDRVAEGLITDIRYSTIIVQLSGRMPESRRGRTWRLDKAANRVNYERTLTALLQLACDSNKPEVDGC